MSETQKYDEYGRPIYTIDYPVLGQFFQSKAPVSVIQGPVGSGKSKVCNLKAFRVMSEQAPGPDGIRRTRGAVIRNTYPELISTTMRTWKDTFPENLYGRIVMSKPATQRIRFGDIDAEIDFLALDSPDDVKKLRSSEYTWAYINELQYLLKVIFDEIQSRVEMGRYPAMKDGGPSWHGIFADMNAPDEDHFIAMMTGQSEWPDNMPDDERASLTWPKEWDFFMQPPGLLEVRSGNGEFEYTPNPAAENIKWLAQDAYIKMIKAKTRNWIKASVLNQPAMIIEGSPVWPMFRRDFHVARETLSPIPNHEVTVALDFGRVYPAALFGQQVGDRDFIQYEMLGFNEHATVFAPKVKRFLEQKYPGFKVRFTGDPKGRDKGSTDGKSSYEIFQANDMKVIPSPVKGNDIETRTEAVAYALNDNPAGVNRMVISPVCRTLIAGMNGKYHLVKEENGELKPKKDKYSNLCDCLQYWCLALGEGRRMIGLEPAHNIKPARIAPQRRSLRRVVS